MSAPPTEALRLIVILDVAAAGDRDLASLAGLAAHAGATMLQVRSKTHGPGPLAALTRAVIAAAGPVPVVVNDRLDVALAAGAAGCHLGQDDLPIDTARRLAPAGFIFGGSAGTAEEAQRAVREGCDYLGIGPINVSPSKHDAGAAIGAAGFATIRAAAGATACVAIGGVQARDVPALMAAGASGVAVIGAALGAADVSAAVRELRNAVDCVPGRA